MTGNPRHPGRVSGDITPLDVSDAERSELLSALDELHGVTGDEGAALAVLASALHRWYDSDGDWDAPDSDDHAQASYLANDLKANGYRIVKET